MTNMKYAIISTMITETDCFQVLIQSRPLDLMKGFEFVHSKKCGAVSSFFGTIRDTDIRVDNQQVQEPIEAIYYESYENMAMKQISSIARSEVNFNNLIDSDIRVFIAIRLGLVPVGEVSIAIFASSKRRHTSNSVVMSILEQVKSSVVIWKKIIFSDGSEEWAGPCKSEANWLNRLEI